MDWVSLADLLLTDALSQIPPVFPSIPSSEGWPDPFAIYKKGIWSRVCEQEGRSKQAAGAITRGVRGDRRDPEHFMLEHLTQHLLCTVPSTPFSSLSACLPF